MKHSLGKKEELASRESSIFEFNGKSIVVFPIDGELFALEEMCPHRGAPLSEGSVTDGVVRCPWHAAKFEIKTGKVLTGPAKRDLKRFPLSVNEEGEVFVEL